MARLEARRWEGHESGLTRRPCDYAVYIPDPLVGRRFVLDGDVAADVADAEAALVRLDATARRARRHRGAGPAAAPC